MKEAKPQLFGIRTFDFVKPVNIYISDVICLWFKSHLVIRLTKSSGNVGLKDSKHLFAKSEVAFMEIYQASKRQVKYPLTDIEVKKCFNI